MRLTGDEIPTIAEWGGGRAAFHRWLDAFHDLVEPEPDLARSVRRHRQRGAPRRTRVPLRTMKSSPSGRSLGM
jgi:hypothetical protein